MMKSRIAFVALVVSFVSASVSVSANPHMGKWKLNEAKSKMAPGMGKNITVVYAEMKDKVQVTVDGVDKDGKATHAVWVGAADGKAYKTNGNLASDPPAYTAVTPHTLEPTTITGGYVLPPDPTTSTAAATSGPLHPSPPRSAARRAVSVPQARQLCGRGRRGDRAEWRCGAAVGARGARL